MARRVSAVLMVVVPASACASPRVVRLETGQGPALEYRPPTWNQAVEVSALDFEQALERLVLQEPLALRPAGEGWLVRAASSRAAGEDSTGSWVAKALGGPCLSPMRAAVRAAGH
jgi:hypothetical protein